MPEYPKIKLVNYLIQAPLYESVVMTKTLMRIWWSKTIHARLYLNEIAASDIDTSQNSKMKTDASQNSKMKARDLSQSLSQLEIDNKLNKNKSTNVCFLDSDNGILQIFSISFNFWQNIFFAEYVAYFVLKCVAKKLKIG